MRCFFNLVEAHQTLVDEKGVEVEDVEEARSIALKVAREMLDQNQSRIDGWQGWRLEATDGSGTVLFTIRLYALLNWSGLGSLCLAAGVLAGA